jgi:hypothetical protein
MGDLFQPWHLIVVSFILAFLCVPLLIVPFWKIFKKAGFEPALSLLMLVPWVNIAMLFWLAFANWPALKKSE